MSEKCLMLEDETFNESQLLSIAPYCASVCIPRMMQRVRPDTTSDLNCNHELVTANRFLTHLGGRQRAYEDQSVCLESGEIAMIEEYSFKCVEN